jgi:hypothetical protein
MECTIPLPLEIAFHKLLSTSQLEESEKAEAQSIYDKIKAIRKSSA